MSGSQTRTVESSARGVRARAAQWLERRVSEDWGEKDQRELDSWLAASPTHRLAYLRVNAAWNNADRLAALHVLSPPNTDGVARKRFFPRASRAAAALIAFSIAGITAATLQFGAREKNYATDIGGHKTIMLADGSRIELNTDTTLRVALSANMRDVFLDKGEAFFQVRHDAARPFVVMVGGHRVVDLGTKFLVRRDTNRTEVALVEGRARFERAERNRPPQSALLMPGDVLIATGTSMSVTKNSVRALESDLGWRRGVLIFYHTTLADAANEFNRYNRQKLVVTDAAAARLRIDGTFLANNVQLFGRVTHVVLGLHVQNLGDEVVISR